MTMKLRFLPLWLALLAGCGDGGDGLFVDDCSSEISAAIRAYGQPQRVSETHDRWYHSVTYRWPYHGLQKTFTWGGDRWGCSISRYEFSPYRPPQVIYPTENVTAW
jgi:hypothetical protein